MRTRADLDLLQLFNCLLKLTVSSREALYSFRALRDDQLYFNRAFWSNSSTYKELSAGCRLEMFTALMSSHLTVYKLEPSGGILSATTTHHCSESFITTTHTYRHTHTLVPAEPKPSIRIVLVGLTAHWRPHPVSAQTIRVSLALVHVCLSNQVPGPAGPVWTAPGGRSGGQRWLSDVSWKRRFRFRLLFETQRKISMRADGGQTEERRCSSTEEKCYKYNFRTFRRSLMFYMYFDLMNQKVFPFHEFVFWTFHWL